MRSMKDIVFHCFSVSSLQHTYCTVLIHFTISDVVKENKTYSEKNSWNSRIIPRRWIVLHITHVKRVTRLLFSHVVADKAKSTGGYPCCKGRLICGNHMRKIKRTKLETNVILFLHFRCSVQICRLNTKFASSSTKNVSNVHQFNKTGKNINCARENS